MKRIATMDLETDPFMHLRVPKPFCLGFYDGIIYRDFWGADCVSRFIEFIREGYDTDDVIIYAHNGGRFDFHYLLQYFDAELTIINGSIVKARIGNIEFRDSYFVLPVALKQYKKDVIDYSLFEVEERDKPKNQLLIREYLKSDCIYLHEWVTKFVHKYGLYLTLATASFNQLKATGYELTSTNYRYDDVFRAFYYGGRVQVFKGGVHTGKFGYFDINSAYPFAMLQCHPWGSRYRSLDYLPESRNYFATVTAKSRGALPFRDEITGKLSFPDDGVPRKYSATGWEIAVGLETDTLEIVKIHDVLQHEQAYSFTSFVTTFYRQKLQAKKDGNKDMELFIKLILNACYGKFALNPEKYQHFCLAPQGYLPDELVKWFVHYHVDSMDELKSKILDDDSITDKQAEKLVDAQTSWHVVADTALGITIWARNDPNDRYYNVATAASITGYVRAMLWRTICDCKNVVYCDTDSIMCSEFNGTIGDELGAWKKEADLQQIWIGGKKLYAASIAGGELQFKGKQNDYGTWLKKNWKIASKGSRLTPNEIIRLVESGDTINWQNAAPSFSLRYGPRFVDRNIKITC